MTGIVTKTLTRAYSNADPQDHVPPGRPTGLTLADANAQIEYAADYAFDDSGRFKSIIGPGVPDPGASYDFLADSDLVEWTYFGDPIAPTATVQRGFEPHRDLPLTRRAAPGRGPQVGTLRVRRRVKGLIALVENSWGGSLVSEHTYASDDLGRRTSEVRRGPGFDSGSHFKLYTYNDRNELTLSRRPALDGPKVCQGYEGTDPADTCNPHEKQWYRFQFDGIGNRTSYVGDGFEDAKTYLANNVNQYTETFNPSEAFAYDDDGNLTQDSKFDYVWDAQNRLIAVEPRFPTASCKKLALSCDYMNRRIEKKVYNRTGSTWSASPSTHLKFVYDGWNLLEELDGLNDDAVLRQYTWGLDLSGQNGSNQSRDRAGVVGLHAAGGIGGLLGMQAGSTSYIYFYDANRNVMQVMRADTNVLGARYELYPYGGELLATGTIATTNPFRFSTKYWDTESQLYYFGYRYLRPKLGRWLNRDPVFDRGFNLVGTKFDFRIF